MSAKHEPGRWAPSTDGFPQAPDADGVDGAERAGHLLEVYSQSLLEALPVAVYATDSDGRITFYNSAAARLWGRLPRIGEDLWSGAWRLYWLDGRRMRHDECPMAIALKTGRPVRGAEAMAERPDGTRISFIPYPTPMFDRTGKLLGAVNMLVDITERKQLELASQRLAAIVEGSNDAIVAKNLQGIIESWNKGAESMFGFTAEEVIGKSILLIIPEDRHADEELIIGKIGRGERIEHYETVRRRKDGILIDVSITVSPLFDGSGKVIGASKIARDITDRKRADAQRNLLLGEMKHRAKNFQALLDAIARQSVPRDNPEVTAAIDTLVERLKALLLTGEIVVDSENRSASLRTLFTAALSPFLGSRSIDIEGPDVEVPEATVGRLGLAVHELATNAVKYGSLRDANGRVSLTWSLNRGRVAITWKETTASFSPPSVPRRGFGTRVIESAVQHEKDGEVTMDFEADGLRCRFEFTFLAHE